MKGRCVSLSASYTVLYCLHVSSKLGLFLGLWYEVNCFKKDRFHQNGRHKALLCDSPHWVMLLEIVSLEFLSSFIHDFFFLTTSFILSAYKAHAPQLQETFSGCSREKAQTARHMVASKGTCQASSTH